MTGTEGRALVVGNTDGIGLALTKRLLSSGWSVVGVSRRASSWEASGYTHLLLDVSSPGYRAALEELQKESGAFALCVYCAGIGELFDPQKLDQETQVLRVNLVGAIETAAAVLPSMISAGSGHWIGLSSIGDGVSPEAPSYAASKAGLSSYLGGLSLALRPTGVAVTNIRFGFVETKMAKSPVKPFLISAEEATDVILRAIKRRPARVTYPKKMGALVWLLNCITSVRLWLR